MKLVILLISSFLTIANVAIAWADPVLYNVTAVFNEPMLQPVNTTFTGSFTWDSSRKQITNLRGTMNQAMMGVKPALNVSYQVLPSASDGNGGVLATAFKNNSKDVFSEGGYATGGKMTNGSQNAYFTININPANPATVSTSNLNNLVYADCSDGGLMGTFCMTGHAAGGAMGATPLSLTITPAPVTVPQGESKQTPHKQTTQ